VLFGKCLPRLGVYSDIVAQVQDVGGSTNIAWPAGQARIIGRHGSRLLAQLQALANDVRVLASVRRGTYDAIQVRDKPLSGVLGLPVARILGLPFCFWLSYAYPESDVEWARIQGATIGWLRMAVISLRGRLSYWLLYRWLLPRADHVFVQSDAMLAAVEQRGVARARLTAVPMGVDTEVVSQGCIRAVDDPRLAGRRPLTYLGALERVRRVDVLLDVLTRVKERVPNAILVLVGDAFEEADRVWLRDCIAQKGLADSVIQTGNLPTMQALSYVVAAEVGLSYLPRGPVYDVSSPTKAIEYMALGCPVVANDIPDQRRVLEESGAGICTATNVDEFSAAILQLMLDPARRERMAALGPPYVERERSYARLAQLVAKQYATLLRKEDLESDCLR